MQNSAPRLLLAGTGSGCGKTTVTTALLRALQRRGVPLAAFKCGPDYIDPMFHTEALGVPSRNLDLFFVDETEVRGQLARHVPADGVGIIEGVMGFYDGVSGNTDIASAAHLARATDTPSVLIARPRGQSLSLAAEIKGFREFAPNTLAGVILNGVSAGMYPFYRAIAEQAGLPVFGFVPPVPESEIPDRHLGLVTATEIGDLPDKLDRLADAAETGLDLDGLLALARTAPPLADQSAPLVPVVDQPVRIAVARDKAFCFYYADNLDVLRALGAELVPFSPLTDRALPERIDGLYLGGGYPEVHKAQLAANRTMRDSIHNAVLGGLPTIAECGGFLYLHRTLDGAEMAGVLDADAKLTKKLQPFGYVTLTARRDNLLCRAGGQIRAHEFHYAVSTDEGADFDAQKPNGRAWACVHATDTLYAGFPHLYFRSNPAFAENFVRRAARKG
ncbi:cobyrinate a,c-diamide synthase [Agathobaculum sp. Marseille-P7918]|uniref:cobyrinate a,c-diamide synthase n=1 Tax=Agathobaculum sp. Marseille-P7918 TaxID=2479843 RepID=UPI000F63C15F|nr:cobyrinate a,c-diamide synthase [Agathobaculum sp. Marseille-P7918]